MDVITNQITYNRRKCKHCYLWTLLSPGWRICQDACVPFDMIYVCSKTLQIIWLHFQRSEIKKLLKNSEFQISTYLKKTSESQLIAKFFIKKLECRLRSILNSGLFGDKSVIYENIEKSLPRGLPPGRALPLQQMVYKVALTDWAMVFIFRRLSPINHFDTQILHDFEQ